MHLDACDEANITKQGEVQLGEPIARIAGVQALIEHHLLAVVRPSLEIACDAEDLAHVGGKVFGPEELHVWPGHTSCTEMLLTCGGTRTTEGRPVPLSATSDRAA
jgi:hypothetical protein